MQYVNPIALSLPSIITGKAQLFLYIILTLLEVTIPCNIKSLYHYITKNKIGDHKRLITYMNLCHLHMFVFQICMNTNYEIMIEYIYEKMTKLENFGPLHRYLFF